MPETITSTLFSQNKKQQQKLSSIFSSIFDGILCSHTQNCSNRILMANIWIRLISEKKVAHTYGYNKGACSHRNKKKAEHRWTRESKFCTILTTKTDLGTCLNKN